MSLNHNRRVRLPYHALHVEPGPESSHWWSDGVNTLINIWVSGGIHHSNKTAFSVAFFCRIFCISPRIFPHFLPIPATASPPPLALNKIGL